MAEGKKKVPNAPGNKLLGRTANENTKKTGTFFSKLKRLFIVLFLLFLFLCLIAGGFFVGVYLRVFDTNALNEKLELYKYPVLNAYFVKPDNVPEEETAAEKNETAKPEAAKPNAVTPTDLLEKTTVDPLSKPIILTKEEIERQTQLRQAEEKKRVTKLARLYGDMKADKAAAILDELNDDMIIAILGRMDEAQVSKILVAFEADKSARLTKLMYNGKPTLTNPAPTPRAEGRT